MNGWLENVHFPSVSLSVAMPKVDPRFGTGQQAREQMGIHLFGGGGGGRPEGEREGCFGHYHYYNGRHESPLGVGRFSKCGIISDNKPHLQMM